MSQDTRVFGIGMNKTGTSSLGRCLRALGITPVPSQYDIKTADLIDPILLDGNYEPALGFARSYRGFEDRPWNVWDMYRRLDERYPESLFVLTVRDVDKWWRSVQRWLTVVKPNIRERYMLHLRAESFTREDFVRGYEAYNREVGAYFEDGRADRLLVIDFAEGRGWEPLCAFLDRPVPADRPFPHVNRQGYRSAARRQARDGRPLDLERCFSCGHSAAMERVEAGEDEPERRRFEALRRPLAQLRNRILKQQQSSRSYSERRLHRLRSAMPQLRIDDLAVVTAYYNPGRSKQRLANLRRFNDGMRRSGVPLLTVELAFKDRPHEASGLYGDVLELRAEHVMWHKERLLNIGIRSLLDRGFRNIVWLDSDVLFFEAENWPWHVAAELERSHLCQVFSRVLLQRRQGQPATLSVSGV
ncbi:MAG: hypothetical protein O7G30_18040, partial [Proteobacteria bacterium]|nr:hypothetical protein [Pseudomonadota bacterium]